MDTFSRNICPLIGIDLVNLKDPKLQKRTARALKLINHPNDQYPEHPQIFWLLWVAKEAVFKAKREIKSFSPTQIPVQIFVAADHFNYRSEEFSGEIYVDHDLIYATAHFPDRTVLFQIEKQQTKSPKEEVRDRIVAHFHNHFAQTCTISTDTNGLPVLNPGNIPVSFTHHAGYIGFCWPE